MCYQQTHCTALTAESWPSHTIASGSVFFWHVRNCSVLWQFKQRFTASCARSLSTARRICGCDVTAGRFFSWSRIACNPKVHYRIHNSSSCPPPLILQLLTSILQLSFHIHICRPGFPNKTLCHFSSSTILATYASLLVPAVITWIISNHENPYVGIFSIPLSLPPSERAIFLSTLFSNTLSCHLTNFHMHVIKQAKLC